MKIIEFLTKCNWCTCDDQHYEIKEITRTKPQTTLFEKKSMYHQYKHTVGEVLLQNTHVFIPGSLISSKYSAIHWAVFTAYNWSTSGYAW
jgi:hypothetical protein